MQLKGSSSRPTSERSTKRTYITSQKQVDCKHIFANFLFLAFYIPLINSFDSIILLHLKISVFLYNLNLLTNHKTKHNIILGEEEKHNGRERCAKNLYGEMECDKSIENRASKERKRERCWRWEKEKKNIDIWSWL